MNVNQLNIILDTLPDPTFLITKQGRYVEAFGGKDSRYYPDAKELVGHNFKDLVSPEVASWAFAQIQLALETKQLVIVEYELSKNDFRILSSVGPDTPIWFEGRIQALDFQVDGEDVVLWVASNISERHALEVELKKISDTDQLTGLFNRRRLEHELALFLETVKRNDIPTTILMCDVDNLKLVNDTHGHMIGDELITIVAKTFLNELRLNDIASRFGGDEFVLVLPSTNSEQAVKLAQRIHSSSMDSLSKFNCDTTSVSLSIGITAMLESDESYQETLERADQALYLAKKTGKNKIALK